ncbi:MAG: zf-HC2 domain-containing protein [Oscillospiraceae bacterium]|nr:zf-HC2 domain-containing protein [Oscillospiraceae bacterium]
MQDCSNYNIMLSAYLDGELHGKEAKELEKHLRTCVECQKYLALLKSVKEGLKEELPPAPETLRQGIAYKLELEKKRQKLYFGAFGRWTAIAAVLCLVVFGVVKLTGSGVSRTEQAAPAAVKGGSTGGSLAPAESAYDAAAEPDGVWTNALESKTTAAGGAVLPPAAPVPAAGSAGSDFSAEEEAPAEEENGSIAYAASGAMPAPAAPNAPMEEPVEEPASPYLTDSLRGSDAGLSAMGEGEFYGVIVFYDALPEGVSQKDWAMQTPREGELGRWLVPAEDLKGLLDAGICDEVYFGDRMAGQGLVLLVAAEEE